MYAKQKRKVLENKKTTVLIYVCRMPHRALLPKVGKFQGVGKDWSALTRRHI